MSKVNYVYYCDDQYQLTTTEMPQSLFCELAYIGPKTRYGSQDLGAWHITGPISDWWVTWRIQRTIDIHQKRMSKVPYERFKK